MAFEAGPEAGLVLALGRALHASGTPSHRLEDTLSRVSSHLGIEGQFFTQPTSIFAAFGPLERQRTFLIRVEPSEVQLDRLSQVQDVVVDVLSGTVSPDVATARLEAIARGHSPYPEPLALAAFAVSGAAAARFLGGGFREIVAAGGIGLVAGALALGAARSAGLRRVFEPAVALLATVVAGALTRVLGPFSMVIATLAGMIVLLPGLSLTTAMTELASRHLAAGTARLSGAVMVFLALGFGAALGGVIDRIVFGVTPAVTPSAPPAWTEWAALLIAPLAIMILLRAPRRDAPWVVLTCIVAFIGGRLGAAAFGPELGLFVGSLLAGLAANLYARGLRRPAPVALVPALLMLVPGSVGFRSLALLLERNVAVGVELGFRTVLMTAALVAGLLVANVVLPEGTATPRAQGTA